MIAQKRVIVLADALLMRTIMFLFLVLLELAVDAVVLPEMLVVGDVGDEDHLVDKRVM
jgi:hypothetical protein